MCRRHGGSAPQVKLAAQRTVLLEGRYLAYLAWQAEHDRSGHQIGAGQLMGPRESTAMGALAIAERALEQFDRDVDLIHLLRMELRDPSSPGARRALLELARDRLERRPRQAEAVTRTRA